MHLFDSAQVRAYYPNRLFLNQNDVKTYYVFATRLLKKNSRKENLVNHWIGFFEREVTFKNVLNKCLIFVLMFLKVVE